MWTTKSNSFTRTVGVVGLTLLLLLQNRHHVADAKLADRSRVVEMRNEQSHSTNTMNSRVYGTRTRPAKELPLEGPKYRGKHRWVAEAANHLRDRDGKLYENNSQTQALRGKVRDTNVNVNHVNHANNNDNNNNNNADSFERELNSQLTGCCSTYSAYTSDNMCYRYGENCATGAEPSHDSGDEDCEMSGLSFIGISFSVNTASGNPYSYQLCDQFPMENIIDRDYDYVMSMDEDGWLVGGGYKSFDYSGKMPYIDSSHTELLRIGSLDPEYGGTTIWQVYAAMSSIQFPPFAVFPEYVKGGGKGGSNDGDDEEVPSGDITLIVSIVEEFEDNDNYSIYEEFLDDLFNAMNAVNGGPCMDDHDTDPHVSMSRGVKFESSYHEQQYFYQVNLEVAVWQSMYPKGVVIGSSGKTNFPPENASKNRSYIGYGNLYFFFDRANITKAFPAERELYNSESYYSKLTNNDISQFYASTTSISFDYSGSGSKDNSQYYEHNPYRWNAEMAMHDMTGGWDLPPNCKQEGENFLGIPLSRASSSKLQSTSTFQNQFDFEFLVDRNYTYMDSFGTNHGWLIGETLNNGPGSIVDKDTSHIPLFYTGTSNANMGGISLSNIIKVLKQLEFGTLYIKPAFVFQDEDGAVKLQFEADPNSALGYLYDNLCKMLGLSWNYDSPSNSYDYYTNCAMHASGDRAKYGCGPEGTGAGGFCPQMTLGYRVSFQSEDAAADFFARGNSYVDYWRSLYPTGVAVGTTNFCPDGGCLGLYLNRQDLYQVFKPDGGGSWVEYNGATFAPTISPAPTADGGCDNPHNSHLDKCFRKQNKRKAPKMAWESLGPVGQLSVFLVSFMAVTLSTSIFLARARKKKRRGESYMSFMMRDMTNRKKRRKKKLRKKKRRNKNASLEEGMLDGGDRSNRPPRGDRSKSKSRRSRSRPRGESSRGGRSQSRSRLNDEDKSKRSSSRHKRSSSSRPRSSSRRREEDRDRGGDRDKEKRSSDRDRGESRRPSSRSRSRSKRESSRSRSRSRSRRDREDRESTDMARRQLV